MCLKQRSVTERERGKAKTYHGVQQTTKAPRSTEKSFADGIWRRRLTENKCDRSQCFSCSILWFRFSMRDRLRIADQFFHAGFGRCWTTGDRSFADNRWASVLRLGNVVNCLLRNVGVIETSFEIDLSHDGLIFGFRRCGKRTLRHQTFEGHFRRGTIVQRARGTIVRTVQRCVVITYQNIGKRITLHFENASFGSRWWLCRKLNGHSFRFVRSHRAIQLTERAENILSNRITESLFTRFQFSARRRKNSMETTKTIDFTHPSYCVLVVNVVVVVVIASESDEALRFLSTALRNCWEELPEIRRLGKGLSAQEDDVVDDELHQGSWEMGWAMVESGWRCRACL